MREIRIRELRYEEARARLEDELNRAFMEGEMRVHVLHGIGEGILKKILRGFFQYWNHPVTTDNGSYFL